MEKEDVLKIASPVESERSSGVYFLINKGEIVYVGQTRYERLRVITHYSTDKEFDSYSFFPVKENNLNQIESREILRHAPLYNRTLGCDFTYKRLAKYLRFCGFSIDARKLKSIMSHMAEPIAIKCAQECLVAIEGELEK